MCFGPLNTARTRGPWRGEWSATLPPQNPFSNLREPSLPLKCKSGPELPGQSRRLPVGLPGGERAPSQRRASAAPRERRARGWTAPAREGREVGERPASSAPRAGSASSSCAPLARRAAIARARWRGARLGRPLLSALGPAGDARRRLLGAAARFELGVGLEPRAVRGRRPRGEWRW